MYKYEMHLHTKPVSECARATVRENLEFYKELGYDGVFITDHFIDGNLNIERDRPYDERIRFYYSSYREALEIGKELGIRIFSGVEMSYKGTDFLVYGLDEEWWLEHPEIEGMQKSKQLPFLMESGGFVAQAHPYRQDRWIDHIRLFPQCVHAVETTNACRKDFDNALADAYADAYGLLKIAGTDNHLGRKVKRLAGLMTETPISNEADMIQRVKDGKAKIFLEDNPFFEE